MFHAVPFNAAISSFASFLASPDGTRCVLCHRASHRAPPSPVVSGGDVQLGGTCRKRSIFIQKKAWFRPGFTLLRDFMGGALSTVKAFSELLPDSTD